MSTPVVSIVVFGDSLLARGSSSIFQWQSWTSVGDAGVPGMQASAQYYATVGGKSVILRNMAVSGTHLNTGGSPDLVPLFAAYSDRLVQRRLPRSSTRRFSIGIGGIGTNDSCVGVPGNFTGYAAAVGAEYQFIKSTLSLDRFVAATILRSNAAPMIEGNRAGFNGIVNGASWQATYGIDAVWDRGANPAMQDPTDLTKWDPDQVHPNSTGFATEVAGLDAVLLPMIAAL